MKNIIPLLFIGLLLGCNNAPKKEESKAVGNVQNNTSVKESKQENKTNSGTLLCKINGKEWAYTKASGIAQTYPRTKQRTALITFSKKLEKGKETIQLEYDLNSLQLIKASLDIKFTDKDGKPMSCNYYIGTNDAGRNTKGSYSGSIDLTNPTAASGTAELSNLDIKYEKERLDNPANAVISITDLKFSGVGYSDLDKLFK